MAAQLSERDAFIVAAGTEGCTSQIIQEMLSAAGYTLSDRHIRRILRLHTRKQPSSLEEVVTIQNELAGPG